MWKNRAGYALAVAALAALVWLFGRPFLVCALVLAAGLPLVQLALLKRDAGAVSVSLSVRPGGREGEALPLCFEVENGRALHAARSIYLDLAMNNLLLGEETHRRVMLTLSDGANRFSCPIVPPCCGEIVISCRETGLCDLLHLFRERVAPFGEVRTVIYPRPVQLELTLSRDAVGETGDSGLTRSRKGTDASEMFDIRSYVPGDDIRSIHWKLSGKTDELIVRQASDRTHYDLVILPDFGRKQGGRGITAGELTRCVALVIELSRRLVRRGVPLCVAARTGRRHGAVRLQKRARARAEHPAMAVHQDPRAGRTHDAAVPHGASRKPLHPHGNGERRCARDRSPCARERHRRAFSDGNEGRFRAARRPSERRGKH